jgi:hypothetical protein
MATLTYDVWVTDANGQRVRKSVSEDIPDPGPQQVNADALHSKAAAALDRNVAYLAVTSPTNAQVAAQVKLLTQENSALIRMVLGLLDSTDGA